MSASKESIRNAARNLRVQPPRSAWKRVESRLETQQIRRSSRVIRTLSYAAAAALLIMLSVAGLYLLNQPELTLQTTYSHTLEDLEATGSDGESIFDIAKVKSISALMQVHPD